MKSETSELGYVTAYAYDLAGNLIKRTEPDPDGATSTLTSPISFRQYDALNRLTASLDEREGVTRYTYDGVGNVTSLTDPTLNTTTFAFDRLDRVTSETNQRGDARKFEYDANSNLTKQIDREGRVRKFTYDNLDRAKTEEWFANIADNSADRTFAWTYNLADELTGVTDRNAAGAAIGADYAYTRDKLGQITAAARTHVGLGSAITMTHTWDALGRRTTMEADIGATNDFKNIYKYDGLSRLKRVDQDKQGSGGGFNAVAEKRVDLAYDQLGRFTSVARYKDIDGGATNEVSTSSYLYDNGGRLTNLTHKKGTTTQEGFTWSFDALDRVTQVVSTVDGTSAYKYDATDQLIAADHDATLNPQTADESYVNDLSGNRRASGTTNWKVDTDNRLSRDGVFEYTYDKEGNLTKRVALDGSGVANGATTEYAWDQRNRLTTVTEKPTPGGAATKIVKYEYDAFDRRISKSLDSDANGSSNRNELFIWSGDDVIFDFVDPDGAGAQPVALAKRYLWGEAVDQLLAQEDVTTGVLWPLGDNLNTTRDLVDNAGAVQTHYKYDAFGRVTSGDTTKTRFLYTAQEYDSDTGLVYYNARWYDPRQGRFLSQDSWGFAAGDENLYRNVWNSPTNYVDPTGHAPIDSVPPGGVAVDPNKTRMDGGGDAGGITILPPPGPVLPPPSPLPPVPGSPAAETQKFFELLRQGRTNPYEDEKKRDTESLTALWNMLSDEQKAGVLSLLQLGVDVAGILDPTPISDGCGTVSEIYQGNYGMAVLSAVSMFPYAGDLAKIGKVARYVDRLKDALKAFSKSEKVMEAVLPMVRRLHGQLDEAIKLLEKNGCVPKAVLEQFKDLRKQLDDFLAKASKKSNDATKRRVDPRKKTREEIDAAQPRNEKGEMVDPHTGEPLKEGEIDLGHKPGEEWRKRKKMHEEKGSTREEVLDAENDSSLYHWEDRKENQGHKHEEPD